MQVVFQMCTLAVTDAILASSRDGKQSLDVPHPGFIQAPLPDAPGLSAVL
jgi:hypothetical protein